LPPGWRRCVYLGDGEAAVKNGWLAGGRPNFLFHHVSDPQPEFWYPIPLCDPADSPQIPPPPRFLFGHTQRTWLYASETIKEKLPMVSVRIEYGSWAGVLYLNEAEDDLDDPQKLAERQLCELVAIS
jgi:hypothetical protein